MRRAWWGALVAALLVLGLAPFRVYLDAVPLQPDSIKWIENAVPGGEGWSRWTFQGSHFVGYRPLTALSFTADLGLFGASAAALRWTDVGLHLFSALMVFALAFTLAGRRRAGAVAGVLALAWFLWHAGTDEVVPFLSRRSYPLAVCLALLGLWLAERVGRHPGESSRGLAGSAAAVAVGPLLALSMFGNELGALLAVALPFVVFSTAAERPLRRTVLVTLWGWAWIGAGVWIRSRVLAGDSGYEVEASEPGRGLEVWKLYGAGLAGQLGPASALWCGAAVALGIYYLAVCLRLATARITSLPLGLVLVLIGYGAVVANEGVWFPRQIYPASALVALILGLVAARTLDGPEPVLRLPRWAHAVPQLALFALMAAQSPLVRGSAPVRVDRARVATSFTSALNADLAGLTGPGEVLAIAPVPNPVEESESERRESLRASDDRPTARLTAMRVPFRWLRLVHAGAEWTLRDVLFVCDPEETHPPTRAPGDVRRLTLPAGATCYGVPRKQIVELPAGQGVFELPKRRDAAVPTYLWIYGNQGLTQID